MIFKTKLLDTIDFNSVVFTTYEFIKLYYVNRRFERVEEIIQKRFLMGLLFIYDVPFNQDGR